MRGLLNSTYIGETLRGGPEKKTIRTGTPYIYFGKTLTWCSGEVGESHFSTLRQCKLLQG